MDTLVQRAMKKDAESFIRLMEENKQSMLKVAYGFFSNEEDVPMLPEGTNDDYVATIWDGKSEFWPLFKYEPLWQGCL